jgi:HK97 family phage major capsid protein
MEMKEILEATKAALESAQQENRAMLKAAQDKTDQAIAEVKQFGTITTETNKQLTELNEKSIEAHKRLLELEQKLALKPGFNPLAPEEKSIADIVIESEEYKEAGRPGGKPEMKAVQVGSFHRKAIINATGQNQPLVPVQRIAFLMPIERRLMVRDLLPVGRMTSNLIEYAKENVFTNSAAVVYSSPNYENITKPESNLTFTLTTAAAITLAHWIAASRQVLSDASMLRSYIENRLMYGLKYVEDDAILNGDGTGGNLDGLMHQATAYAGSGAVSTDTQLDSLLRAMTQVRTGSLLPADGIVVNPVDWMKIRLIKDSTGRYVFSDPHSVEQARAWGVPVVETDAIAATRFLTGNFSQGAQLWDREDATIRIAEQHSDFFVRNMVAILAEERLALTVFRALAFVRGNFLS